MTLPLPGEELVRMRDTLAPDYGSELWERDGHRILVVRVPRDEPDIVNDLEGAVESLSPSDVDGTPSILLLGNKRTHIVPTTPVRELMANRVRFDRAQCQTMRTALKPGEHKVFKAPDDPKRLTRLAIRLPCATVAELGSNEVAQFTQSLGPVANTLPYQAIRAVYLVANKDDVRIEADLFFQDLNARYQEETERRALAQQLVEKEETQRRAQVEERERLMERLEARYPSAPPPPRRAETHASAPLRRAVPGVGWEASTAVHPRGPDEERAALYEAIDALPHSGSEPTLAAQPTMTGAPTHAGAPSSAPHEAAPTYGRRIPGIPAHLLQPEPVPTAMPPPAKLGAPWLATLHARLEELGYDVMPNPGGPHGIDLAAERAAFPDRVIAFAPDRLDKATAEKVLAAAKELGAAMAIVACPEADTEGRRKFIATRAKWITPADIATLAI